MKFILLPLLRLSHWEIVVKWKLITEFQNSSIGTFMQITQLEAYDTSSTGTFINISTLSVSNYERLTLDSSYTSVSIRRISNLSNISLRTRFMHRTLVSS